MLNLKVLIVRVLLGSFFMCASMCGCGEDDISYTRITGTVDNATSLENITGGFQVNDTLFVNTYIPLEFMTSDGLLNVNDIAGLTGDGYNFNFIFSKESQFGDDVIINIGTDNIISITGVTTFDFESLRLVTARETDGFYHRFGIILKESGNYKLSSYSSNSDYIMSYGMYEGDTILELFSNPPEIINEPYFKFTVNP